jgi:hypothetical protein
MHRTILGTVLVFTLAISSHAVFAQEMHPPAKSSPAFDQVKSLVGEWQGKGNNGTPVKATYEIVSNSSVLMERLQPSGEPEMITMYTLEGDHLVVTHYCSAGNQPVMQTPPVSSATGKYEFKFVRASGMKSLEEGHMVALTLSMPDKDHLTELWTFSENGKTSSETITFTRKL